MGFSRQEYWSGLPFLPPGDFPKPQIEPGSPVLQADSLPTELQGKPSAPLRLLKRKSHWCEGREGCRCSGSSRTAPTSRPCASCFNPEHTPTEHFLPRVYRRGSWGSRWTCLRPKSWKRMSPSQVGHISTPVFFLLNIKTTPALKLPIQWHLEKNRKGLQFMATEVKKASNPFKLWFMKFYMLIQEVLWYRKQLFCSYLSS